MEDENERTVMISREAYRKFLDLEVTVSFLSTLADCDRAVSPERLKEIMPKWWTPEECSLNW